MTKASVNFQPVRSATHAVLHASRDVSPSYLLPAQQSFGTIVVRDDLGAVAATMRNKLALSSPQAKAKNSSPLWEGVINLRRPDNAEHADLYRLQMREQVVEWIEKYEKITGHKVLRADVHLDEGHIDDNDNVLLNAHAHVIADRTDSLGKVIRVDAARLRLIQSMTAQATKLERGERSRREHLPHQAYKHLAEQGRLNVQRSRQEAELYGHLVDAGINRSRSAIDNVERLAAKQIDVIKADRDALKHQIAEMKKQYSNDRAAMIASGRAVQEDYKKLKSAHDLALAELDKAKMVKAEQGRLNVQRPMQEAELYGHLVDAGNQRGKAAREAARLAAAEELLAPLKARYAVEREALKASGHATQKEYRDLKEAHEMALRWAETHAILRRREDELAASPQAKAEAEKEQAPTVTTPKAKEVKIEKPLDVKIEKPKDRGR